MVNTRKTGAAKILDLAEARPRSAASRHKNSEAERETYADRNQSYQGFSVSPDVDGHTALFESIALDETQPYIIASVDGTLAKVNDRYKAICDAADSCFLAGPPEAIGKGPVRALLDVIEDMMIADGAIRLEEHLTINGQESIFLTRYLPIRREDQGIIAIAATYEDITRQVMAMRQANLTEERFRDFARASSDWFFETDRGMRFTHLSERFTATVGQPASLFLGAGMDQVGQFGENLDGESLGPRSILRRKPFRDQLFKIEGTDSKLRLFHLSAVPTFNRTDGSFNGYRGVGMEVTERYRQAEESEAVQRNLEDLLRELTRKNMALDQANDKAHAALATKNDFLATMSHELRTPLNAIIGFASSFEQQAFGTLSEKYRDYASDIRRSGEHLLGLINDILDVAVLENGDLSLNPVNIDLDKMVRDTLLMVQPAAEKRGLVVNRPAPTDLEVVADRRRLTQIMVNLLSNAVKFTGEGKAIGVRIEPAKETGALVIEVWDDGIGIAQDDHGRVFEKFEQIKGHIYNREQEGTGLGLHISRELARRMGGDITLDSSPGVGSRFFLTLPEADTVLDAAYDDRFI